MRYFLQYKYRIIKNYFYGLFGFKVRVQLYANPLMKWPVNSRCFCGSKKKFKVCHSNIMAKKIDLKDLLNINKRLEQKGIRL